MKLFAFRVAPYDNGMYVLADDRGDALVVDPSMGEAEALRVVRESRLRVVEILNTHGHGDHVHDNAALKTATSARLGIHRLDADRLRPGASSGSISVPFCEPDDLLEEGPLELLRDVELVALHTPGHTAGSTCFHLPQERILFSGDVLFEGTIGRCDFPGGSAAEMERSLARLAGLPPETAVYPGHGAPTTIARELGWLAGLKLR